MTNKPTAISLLETAGSGRPLAPKLHYCNPLCREYVVEVGEGGGIGMGIDWECKCLKGGDSRYQAKIPDKREGHGQVHSLPPSNHQMKNT